MPAGLECDARELDLNLLNDYAGHRMNAWEGRMSTRHCVCGVAAILMLCTSYASAQTSSPSSSAEDWQFEVVPYLWASGIDGPVGIRDRTADVDASFANILSHLHFASMALADAQRDRLVVMTDVLYTDLRGHSATPGPLFSSVDPQQRLFIFSPAGGFRVLDRQGTSVDVVGGIRFWRLKTELQFETGLLPGIGLEASRSWVDGIAGLRARTYLSSKWWVSGYGDLGAGGSQLTYQIVGNAGVDIHERFALDFGYRYLSVDYDKDTFLFDTAIHGPLFGFIIKF
jgi:hypothetical protein